MNRRRFFGVSFGGVVAGLLGRRCVGFMDVRRWHDEWWSGRRVFVAGVDITDDCRAFDDREGWAQLLVRPAQLNGDQPLTVIVYGDIEVRR